MASSEALAATAPGAASRESSTPMVRAKLPEETGVSGAPGTVTTCARRGGMRARHLSRMVPGECRPVAWEPR